MTELQKRQMAKWIELTRILQRDTKARMDMKDIIKYPTEEWVDRMYPQPKRTDPLGT